MSFLKRTLATLAAVILLFAALALPARAQFRPRSGPLSLSFDIGYMNINSHPRWVTLGAGLQVRLGRALSLDPEVALWVRDFLTSAIHFVPGGTVNLHLGGFFLGGGAVRRISEWTEQASGSLVPKLQAGFEPGPVRLAAVLLFLDRTDTFVLGLTFGFRI